MRTEQIISVWFFSFLQFELCTNRSIQSMLRPKGTKVTSDGKVYFFEVEFDGIKFMLAEADQVRQIFGQYLKKYGFIEP